MMFISYRQIFAQFLIFFDTHDFTPMVMVVEYSLETRELSI